MKDNQIHVYLINTQTDNYEVLAICPEFYTIVWSRIYGSFDGSIEKARKAVRDEIMKSDRAGEAWGRTFCWHLTWLWDKG